LFFKGKKQTLSEGANKKTNESPTATAAKKKPKTGRNENPVKISNTPKSIKNRPTVIFITRAEKQAKLNIMTPPKVKINP
jgi:hypothetical protein